MENKWQSIGIIFFICFISTVGSFYYSKGFFLTRYEIKQKTAKSADQPIKQFDKAILLLVDALRYDFAYASNDTNNYSNQLTVFEDTLNKQRENSWLFEFLADPPTVTMQRIKGITTGSLPTFIDFRDNFHSNTVDEDNLLTQLQLSNKTSIFMGDDTWIGLYPNAFKNSYSFDSFNVKDLHTVDQGVIKHLIDEMSKTNWNLIIGHMLGVDHVGHTYYANHPSMALKLKQVDTFIRKIIEKLDDDTLLLVFGDHGMTDDGNHGGTSRKETNSALFAYSKRPFYYRKHKMGIEPRKILNQIDIVPTLSILLEVGIPFNNLGALIPELFIDGKSINDAFYVNAKQISEYLLTYDTSIKKLPEPIYENLQHEYEKLNKKYLSNEFISESEFLAFINDAAHMCRMIWTEFDTGMMAVGITIIFIGLLSAIVFVTQELDLLNAEKYMIFCCFVCIIHPILSALLFLLFLIRSVTNWKKPNIGFWVTFVFQTMHGYGLFSNSYILKEDICVRFLLQMLLFYLAKSGSFNFKWTIVCAACIRFSGVLDVVTQKEVRNK